MNPNAAYKAAQSAGMVTPQADHSFVLFDGLNWKLFFAQLRQHKVRFALTAVAMVSAVGIVLWVVSAYEVIASRFDEQTSEFVGQYDVFLVPQSLDEGLPEELIQSVKLNPGVFAANPVTQFRMMFRRVGELPAGTPPPTGSLGRLGPTVVGTAAHEPRYPLIDGRWLNPESSTEAVVSSGVADALSIRPGDDIEFRTTSGTPRSLTVVGIVEQVENVEFAMTRTVGGAPGGFNRGPASLAAYVPLQQIESLTGSPPKMNLVEIRIKPDVSIDQLKAGLPADALPVEWLRPEDIRKKLSNGFEAEGARKQAYFVTALSILASVFIIFTTLSMGVSERARQLAVLRAVGLRRSQIARLVLTEAIVFAVLGWLGGLAGGWTLLKLLARTNPGIFPNGVWLGPASVLLTAACSLAGALLASIFPIWKATHVSPLEAMVPLSDNSRPSSWYIGGGLISLLLISINPLLVFLPQVPETVRFVLILFVGGPTTVMGFILITPLIVLGVERILSPLVAGGLCLQTNLVRTQLSNHMWRSSGIAASLMLGLGLYTATQIWGGSMLAGFLPGRWTPDAIIKFQPGLTEEAIAQVRQTAGIRSDECLPIAVEQARLAGDPLKSKERDSAVRQDNAAVIGLDADAAFSGSDPLFQLSFTAGNREEAIARLNEGRNCIVPDTFLKLAGLGVGDQIGLIPPRHPLEKINYTIVGVVAMPGSNWLTKTSGIRKQSVRTAGLIFAPRAQVQRDFELPAAEFFWVNVERGATKESLEERLQLLTVSKPGPMASADGAISPQKALAGSRDGKRQRSSPEKSGQPNVVAARPAGPGGPRRDARGSGGFGDRPVQVTLVRDVRGNLQNTGKRAMQAMGFLPLITLVIVSLGVVNTVAASVRARRWEFGILRSVGLTRWRLCRLIISEAILIGFVASILSFAFGLLTGWTCLGLVRYVSNPWFEGVTTSLTIPWIQLAYGYLLMFGLCFLAALWPAILAGRSEPLALLQAGRAAT